jgi:8-oxo-dGTP pyrophosphatase MutT (NUDIX family)
MDRRRGGRQPIPRPDHWSLGPPPPWHQRNEVAHSDIGAFTAGPHQRQSGLSAAQLTSLLNEPARPVAPPFPDARPAAVLIALADGPDGAEVLLTKRSMQLRHHRGEISFPGGRMDPGETSLETALREAEEEVGLNPRLVLPRGELTHISTIVSKSYIIPHVVEVVERVPLEPTSGEVDQVWWTPISELLSPETYRAEVWGMPPADRLLHFFELESETVWGATAHLLADLLRCTLAPGGVAFPEH